MLHFVGFRNDNDYQAAVRVWGRPDFIHLTHDHRMYGDVDRDNDTVVFSHRADPDRVSQFTDQDHMRHQKKRAFLYYWINLYGVGLNPISANHYKGLAGAGRFA